MKNYLYHIKLFLYRFLILILLFSVSRFLFFLFNINYFESIGFSELIKIHLAGIRFDLSALFYFNLLFILLSLIPGNFKNNKLYQRILFTLFFLVNSVLLATNYIDTKFFDFEHKRLTFDFFSSVFSYSSRSALPMPAINKRLTHSSHKMMPPLAWYSKSLKAIVVLKHPTSSNHNL